MTEPIDLVCKAIKDGKQGLAVFAVRSQGSLPTPKKARMLACDDGSFVGTIGGGKVEGIVQEHCAKAIARASAEKPLVTELLSFSLTGSDVAEDGVLCGGKVTFFLEPVGPEGPAWKGYEYLSELRRVKSTACEVVSLSEGRLSAARSFVEGGSVKKVFGADEEFQDTLSKQSHEIIETAEAYMKRRGSGTVATEDASDRSVAQLYFGPVFPLHSAYIFGGGHCSQALSKVLVIAGLQVTVLDDRKEFLTPELFPDAEKRLIVDFKDPFKKIPEALSDSGFSYIVIMTRGHLCDKDVLQEALRGQSKYIGMIGSKRKVSMVFKYMIEKKGYTEEDLKRVHAPIGLPIGGSSPGEIAVSIAAQILQESYHGRK